MKAWMKAPKALGLLLAVSLGACGPGFLTFPSPGSPDGGAGDLHADAGAVEAPGDSFDGGAPPVDAGGFGDRPIEDMVWINLNYDTLGREPAPTFQADYGRMLEDRLPPGRLMGTREGYLGSPTSTLDKPKPLPDWSSPSLRWLARIHEQPWMAGRRLVFNPYASRVHEGAPAYGPDWEDAIRWRVAQAAKGGFRVDGWLHPNEPDNAGQAHPDFVRDGADGGAAVERNVRLARIMREELKGPSRRYLEATQTGFMAGPTSAFPYARKLSEAQTWTLMELLTFNQGEVLNYWDVMSFHNHRVQSNVEAFDGSPPRDNQGSLGHAWRALQAGQVLNRARGLMPVATTETNVARDHDPGVYADPHRLRALKHGTMFSGLHWYGITLWISYAAAGSGHEGMNYWGSTSPFPAYAEWDTFLEVTDVQRYDIARFTPELPAKSWEDFNKPYSWTVHVDETRAPTVTTGNPFAEWTRVTFPGGRVNLQPGGRNLLSRPVYLRSLARHRLTVEVQLDPASAPKTNAVKLRARGYDKLDGLAEATATATQSDASDPGVGQWVRLEVEFTPRQHSVNGVPNPAYVLFVLDHNGAAPAAFREPTITLVEQ